MVRMISRGVVIILGIFGMAGLLQAAPSSQSKYDVDLMAEDTTNQSSASSAQTYQVAAKKTSTTQKAYRIQNDGDTENSSTKDYQSVTSHPVCEDLDGDGIACENEPAGVDTDGDGRSGEREAQLGIENITNNQSVKILNNLGIGKGLSNFKIAGQTYRSGVLVEEDEEDKEKDEKSKEKTLSSKSGAQTADSQARVLVA